MIPAFCDNIETATVYVGTRQWEKSGCYTVKNGVSFHWFKGNTLGCCIGSN